jgi:hypothetical protein
MRKRTLKVWPLRAFGPAALAAVGPSSGIPPHQAHLKATRTCPWGFLIGITLFSWGGWPPADLHAQVDIKEALHEAEKRCEGSLRKVKNELYINEALLVEKETCIVKEVAGIIVERQTQMVEYKWSILNDTCVSSAQVRLGEFQDQRYQYCMEQGMRDLAASLVAACYQIWDYQKLGLGKEECNTHIGLALNLKINQLAGGSNIPETAEVMGTLYVLLHKDIAYMPIFAIILFVYYVADIFMHARKRVIQLIVVTLVILGLLALRQLMGIMITPSIMVPFLICMIAFNTWRNR